MGTKAMLGNIDECYVSRFSSEAKWARGRYDRAGVEMNSIIYNQYGIEYSRILALVK